jgi:hypothetical protein
MCKQCPDEGYCPKCGEPQGDERDMLLDEWQDQLDGLSLPDYTDGGNPNSQGSSRSPMPRT